MNRIFDSAVLGAGIAGSSLAKALADKGWDTLLFDRRLFPRHKVCGEFLSPEFQVMLQQIGMREAVESLCPALIHRVRLVLNQGESLDISLPETAWGLSRYTLDAKLHSAARDSGAQLHTGTTVTKVIPEENGYTIETSREGEREVFHVRSVIAAWGAHSSRSIPQAGRRSSTPDYMGVKSHFTGIELDHAVELYFFPGGYVGISQVQGGVVNCAALLNKEAFREADKTVMGLIAEAARRNFALHDKLHAAQPVPGSQAAVSPVNLQREPRPWDQFAQVGDAAVMVPPLCGDGMSIALRTSLLCSVFAHRYLGGEISLTRWQNEYSKAFQQEIKRPLHWGNRIQSLSELPVVPSVLLGLAKSVPGVAAFLMQATRLK